MLKYFKRQKSRRHADGENNANEPDDNNRKKRHSLRSTTSFCDEVFLEELLADEDAVSCSGALSLGAASVGHCVGGDEDIFKYQSCLSMSIAAIVNNTNCLSFFIQFLEQQNALALIKFYLDTENFRTAAITQLEKNRTLSFNQKNLEAQASTATAQCKDSANHTATTGEEATPPTPKPRVPELKTICDLSMHKPLTDDEKSQIYEETNKQITKCAYHSLQASSELSLCSEESTHTINPEAECDAASVKDAIAIYQKYLIANAVQFVCLPVSILSQISLLLCKDKEMTATSADHISPSCFVEAQQYVLQQLERDYLSVFLQSAYYCKYCIELIEGSAGELTIYDVLYSEVTLFFFMEFLEQHKERVCLDFWTTAINFRKTFVGEAQPKDEAEVQQNAMIIYDKFFSLQADCRLWLSDRLRSHVEEQICRNGQVACCFDLPLQITAKYLEKKYLADFLKSQLFENYLNELKTKLHEEAAIGTLGNDTLDGALRRKQQTRHRKTRSDCTSESTRDLYKHISQHNTLLASMDNGANLRGSNLQIDSRQLTNPQLLWHRNGATAGAGLKFGRVNSLGRYERDFEAVEAVSARHNWSLAMGGNKIKNAMRKLVNLPEDKVQEEIAWQVAEMIIKDVTNVTLSGQNA